MQNEWPQISTRGQLLVALKLSEQRRQFDIFGGKRFENRSKSASKPKRSVRSVPPLKTTDEVSSHIFFELLTSIFCRILVRSESQVLSESFTSTQISILHTNIRAPTVETHFFFREHFLCKKNVFFELIADLSSAWRMQEALSRFVILKQKTHHQLVVNLRFTSTWACVPKTKMIPGITRLQPFPCILFSLQKILVSWRQAHSPPTKMCREFRDLNQLLPFVSVGAYASANAKPDRPETSPSSHPPALVTCVPRVCYVCVTCVCVLCARARCVRVFYCFNSQGRG